MIKLRTAVAAVAAGGVSLIVFAPFAAAGTHDLDVKNVGEKRFIVADQFQWPRDASPIQRTCGTGTNVHRTWLQPGKWSHDLIIPSLAKDVDCIEVPKGWKLKRSKVGPNSTYVKCSATEDHGVVRKVSPAPWKKKMYLVQC